MGTSDPRTNGRSQARFWWMKREICPGFPSHQALEVPAVPLAGVSNNTNKGPSHFSTKRDDIRDY